MGTNMERKDVGRSAAASRGKVARARTTTADRDLTARLRSQFSSVNSFNDRDNTIASRDLAKVLRISLGKRNIKKKEVCLASVAMGATAADDRIAIEAFTAWFKGSQLAVNGSSKNRLLIKNLVGHPRSPHRNLPRGAFTYGLVMKTDPEGAGSVLTSWDAGERSSRALGARDVIAENRAAIVAGQTTAKAVSAYRRDNIINIDEKHAKANAKVDNFAEKLRGLTFGGLKAVPGGKEPPVSQLIKGGAYGNMPDSAYPTVTGKEGRKLRKPRMTRTTDVRKSHMQKHYIDKEQSSNWTMRKFANVQSHFAQEEAARKRLADDQVLGLLDEVNAEEEPAYEGKE